MLEFKQRQERLESSTIEMTEMTFLPSYNEVQEFICLAKFELIQMANLFSSI